MARAATRLKLVQVPGAGLDRINRAALPDGTMLANAYGHETGIVENVIGAIVALTREFLRLDRTLRRGDWQNRWAWRRLQSGRSWPARPSASWVMGGSAGALPAALGSSA